MNEKPNNYASTQESGPITTEWDSLAAIETTADVAPAEPAATASETADSTNDYSTEQPNVAVSVEGAEETYVVPEDASTAATETDTSNPAPVSETSTETASVAPTETTSETPVATEAEITSATAIEATPEVTTETAIEPAAPETTPAPESNPDAAISDAGIDRPLDIDEYAAAYEQSLEENPPAEPPAPEAPTEPTAQETPTATPAEQTAPAEPTATTASAEVAAPATDVSANVEDEFMPQASGEELPAEEQATYVETLTAESDPTPENPAS